MTDTVDNAVDQGMYVLKGRLVVTWDKKVAEVGEGEAIFMPSGMKYREENPSKSEKTVAVYILAPPVE